MNSNATLKIQKNYSETNGTERTVQTKKNSNNGKRKSQKAALDREGFQGRIILRV